ncbi:MAG: hypothetical protein IE917_13880 [Betaproteobacteria bacterium]|nr:hypothetical protein [Betaproteobacteria bacterium]
MLGSIIRNYKNAGVRVNISLCVQLASGEKQFPPLFVHGASGLEIHKLASAAHRELLRQARNSALPPRLGERFENVAWKVAAFSLIEALPSLSTRPAAEMGMAIPYTCFIAEYLSKTYLEREERDVCISADGEVFINSIAGLHTDSRLLGNYKI